MFAELDEGQLKQLIDSKAVFENWRSAENELKAYKGSLYWRAYGKHADALIKEVDGLPGKLVGPRSEETERIKSIFDRKKSEAKAYLKTIREELDKHFRLNRALGVGRAPSFLIDLLRALKKFGLESHFMVIGTNALYGYETLAGVRFDAGITATLDVDLLWDSRKCLNIAEIKPIEGAVRGIESFLDILQAVDSTFKLSTEADCRAQNAKGFMVDLVRPGGKKLSDALTGNTAVNISLAEGDLWAARIFDMHWLLSCPCVDTYAVSVTGKMARMRCVDPRAFVLHKAWISQQTNREPEKRKRDETQARVMATILENYLPHLDTSNIPSFPIKTKSNARSLGLPGQW